MVIKGVEDLDTIAASVLMVIFTGSETRREISSVTSA
jgi:hypothetical protein